MIIRPRDVPKLFLFLGLLCWASVPVSHAQEAGTCRVSDNATDIALSNCAKLIESRDISAEARSDAYLARAHIWRSRHDADRAKADLDEAIRANPSNVRARISRAIALRLQKSPGLARVDLDAALAVDPNNADVYFQRAFLESTQGDNEHAISDYARSLELKPNQGWAHVNRGFLLRAAGKLDDAMADFDAAIQLAPNIANAHVGRGRILAVRKDLPAARDEFTKAIALDPQYAEAYFQRAFYAENSSAALADYDQVIRLNPQYAIAYANRAGIKRKSNDLDGPMSDLNHALDIDPGFTAALIRRGLIFEQKNDIAHAIADYQMAVSQPPKYDSGAASLKAAKARLAVLTAPSPNDAVDLFAKAPTKSTKIALVIGNGAYANVPKLPNPPTDAHALAASLRDIGFTVIEGNDLDHRGMDEKIIGFLRSVPGAKIALVYYAGHAVQVDGRNYLVPVDASQITRATLSFELVDVDKILAGLDDESRANIIILDACRDDPLESRTAGRSVTTRGGLAAYSDVASGMLVAFATSPGKTASDGTGANSPFATALLKFMKNPVEINEMLREVRVDVFNTTNKQQLPWANSSLLGQVYLTGAADRKSN